MNGAADSTPNDYGDGGRLRICTGTKTIHVRDDVYDRLKAQERPDESFSDLLARLTDRGTQFEHGFGELAEVDVGTPLSDLDDQFESAFRESR